MSKKKKYFILNGGCHREADGKMYYKGDMIETDRDLSTLCGGKFEQVYLDKDGKIIIKGKEQQAIVNRLLGKKK